MPCASLRVLTATVLVWLAAGCARNLFAAPPVASDLKLSLRDDKLTGSFTYHLVVGQFYEWNTDPTAVPSLLEELGQRTGVRAKVNVRGTVPLSSPRLAANPLLMLTGNRAFSLSKKEIANLKSYLAEGGFLYIDDCGGADGSIRRMLADIVPDAKLEPLAADHVVFREPYKLTAMPKVIDLYRGPARCYGVRIKDRLAVIYTYDTDIPCAWERYPDGSYVHVVDANVREAAYQFGVNVLVHALSQRLPKESTSDVPTDTQVEPTYVAATKLAASAVLNLPMKKQLPNNYITAMAADADQVWFGGYAFMPGEDEGLGRYDRRTGKWSVLVDAEGVLSEEINGLALHEGKVYVGADTFKWTRGLACFDPVARTWTTQTKADGLPHDRIAMVATDRDELWVACRQGLARRDWQTGAIRQVSGPPFPDGGPLVEQLAVAPDHVWVGHFNGVARYDKRNREWRDVAALTDLVPGRALGIAATPDATWILALRHGEDADTAKVDLVRFDHQQQKFGRWPAAAEVDLTMAVSLAADAKDVIVGTKEQGLYLFPTTGGPPRHVAMPDPLPLGEVYQALPTEEHLWASILPRGGVWRMERKTGAWEPIAYRAGTPATHILSLHENEGQLYVGTLAHGLWSMDIGTNRFRNLNVELQEGKRKFLYHGDHSSVRWDNIYTIVTQGSRQFAATNHGLVVHDPVKTPAGFQIVGPAEMVSRSLQLARGKLWLVDAAGRVVAYDAAASEWSKTERELAGPIDAACIWNDHFIVASGNEVSAHPIAGGPVRAIAPLDLHTPIANVWATPTGLLLAGPTGLMRVSKFDGRANGVRGIPPTCTVRAVATHDGRIYVGADEGLWILDDAGELLGHYDRTSGLSAAPISAIEVGERYVWLGTLGAGITRIERAALALQKE